MYLTAEFQWLFREEAHDNREFSCENSKPRHDPHGRLVWLLKFTDGEAKETIKHCIQQSSEIGYRPAKSLLEDHYGNPQ